MVVTFAVPPPPVRRLADPDHACFEPGGLAGSGGAWRAACADGMPQTRERGSRRQQPTGRGSVKDLLSVEGLTRHFGGLAAVGHLHFR